MAVRWVWCIAKRDWILDANNKKGKHTLMQKRGKRQRCAGAISTAASCDLYRTYEENDMAKTNQNSIYSTVLVNQPAINVQQVLVGAGIAIAIAIGSVSGVGTTARCYSTYCHH
jgi:hypothetical protein